MHAAKSMVTPGATPNGTAFCRPNFSGSLPALPIRCMRMSWPRAYREVSSTGCAEGEIPITERSKSRCQF